MTIKIQFIKPKPVVFILIFFFASRFFFHPAYAVTVTPTPAKIFPSPSTAVSASPSALPTGIDDEKVKGIREAIKEKVDEIKEKIEKKAYVGVISQITDSTITLDNFRGKHWVRITEETIIIGANKKEIKANDLAVEDKVIALGNLSGNEILEAKRIVVVPKPKTTPVKRTFFWGTVSEINSKKSVITLTAIKDLDKNLEIKIDKNTNFTLQSDLKAKISFKDFKENQKVIAVYSQTTDITPLAISIFILP